MTASLMGQESPARFNSFAKASAAPTVGELGKEEEIEVLDFLAERPLHTVFVSSLIRDNGMVSPHNRGSFYGCRDSQGQLEGVALLGHATLIETRTEDLISVFARLARNCQNAHLIRGNRDKVTDFWKHYSSPGQEPRLIRHEELFTLNEPLSSFAAVDVRPARPAELDKILAVNALMALEEGGISPLQHDSSGFRQRTGRRIEQGRVWVWIRNGRLTFKADVVGVTPEAIYLEGVHVHPEERRKGYGLRCLAQLSSILLAGTKSICLTVHQSNRKALGLYQKAGYQFHSYYETIYLRE